MLTGYVRAVAGDARFEADIAALRRAGCPWTFTDFALEDDGAWPELGAALATMTPNDTLLVVRLAHLGATTTELGATLADCHHRGLLVRSLEDGALILPPDDSRLATLLGVLAGRGRGDGSAFAPRADRARGRLSRRPEARREKRLRVNAEAILIANGGGELPSRLCDLSRGGACVAAPRGYAGAVGDRLRLGSTLLGAPRPVRLVARSPRRLHFAFEYGAADAA